MGDPIRVIPKNPWDKMDPLSRINFLKIYTVEHSVKIDDFGYVHRNDEWKLIAQFNSHWGIPTDVDLPPATRPSMSESSVRSHGGYTNTTAPGIPQQFESASETRSGQVAIGYNQGYNNQPGAHRSLPIISEDTAAGRQMQEENQNEEISAEYGGSQEMSHNTVPTAYPVRPTNSRSSSSEHRSRKPHGRKKRRDS
ncbi:hypothetical protein K469DRAFT_694141 [Zopfia rhizophila CBS 207.26]|uniref:DUF6590 domain-containing protein n=1 Tax=Zopfia rhizophila CBS 207.26 TaxID=1314779 RepID=A0A6A6DIV4_9PEZI|nr:hypothetical protein K469DRAFT_694141 [Zopfia rhizophila CBS 207.26]